ncbi:MAG: peptidylprolyl isomerase [Spirochaetia bacterium]|jgi:peptidylprolyl isomerase|nr:peptidylprolyl isomerase [Spirochaetia bacterium]
MKHTSRPFFILALFLAMTLPCSLSAQPAAPGANLPDGLYAVLSITTGTVIVELFPESAPLAVMSFVGLAEGTIPADGKLYFDNLKFHRVVPGFVVQTGDPTGTGRGGPGYQFRNEIDPKLSFNAVGVLGMANAGPDTNGSQFFITLGKAPHLDGGYSIFGRVVSGLPSVLATKQGDALKTVRILRKGAKAEAYRPDRASFDAARR